MAGKSDAESKLSEIVALLAERETVSQKMAALDRRIAELAGYDNGEKRKPAKKTISRDLFRAACL